MRLQLSTLGPVVMLSFLAILTNAAAQTSPSSPNEHSWRPLSGAVSIASSQGASLRRITDHAMFSVPQLQDTGTVAVAELSSETVERSDNGSHTATLNKLPPTSAQMRYGGAIVITKGGRYSGKWESQNPNVPVVQINTTEPVVIENCHIRGRGNLVSALRDSTDVTIRNCVGESLNPNALNSKKGRFAMLWKPMRVHIENNTLLSTAGIYVNNGNNPTKSIRIRYNIAKNIDGRIGDGRGGYLLEDYFAQFVLLNNVKACPDVEIGWNEIINEPGNSRVADNINIHLSSGIPGRPILIHNNFVRGAYPMDPASARFSGGGIIVDGEASLLSDASGYIKIYDNQVVGTSNHGISVAAGHHVEIVRNRLVSSGLLADGTRVGAANVGLYAWNYYKSAEPIFSIKITENSVGWVNAKGSINNWWFPDCAEPYCSGNQSIRGPITQSMEEDEYLAWRQKISMRNIRLGSDLQP